MVRQTVGKHMSYLMSIIMLLFLFLLADPRIAFRLVNQTTGDGHVGTS